MILLKPLGQPAGPQANPHRQFRANQRPRVPRAPTLAGNLMDRLQPPIVGHHQQINTLITQAHLKAGQKATAQARKGL